MKINVDFSELNNAVSKMGAEPVDFEVEKTKFSDIDIDKILGTTGIEIDPVDLELSNGLLSYKGRQVLLFIPDHGNRVDSVIDNYSNGNKYHISDCATIEKMKEIQRFDRYVVTNNLSGEFDISGYSFREDSHIEIKSELSVCKNCLRKLNYKNYKENKNKVFNEFNLNEFFETYSTLFKHLPKLENTIYKSTYTKDWEDISKDYREKQNYVCESCHTSFKSHKYLLHTHHINGVKTDNKESNLKAVCIDCHRKEPNHFNIMLTNEDKEKIYQLRREQNKVQISNWNDVLKYADLSLHGYINLLAQKNYILPDVGCILKYNNENIILDLVWITPNKKSAVIANYQNYFNIDGWNILSLGEAFERFYNRSVKKLEENHKNETNKLIEEKESIKEKTKKARELESILKYTKQIESILETKGATGRGLHGKLSSIEYKFPSMIVKKVRKIATIRNKVMHESSFTDYSFIEFERESEFVLKYLER